MRIPRIFQNQSLQSQDQVALSPDLSHRLINVLRLKAGDPIILFNGDGYEYKGTVHILNKNRVEVNITEKIEKKNESTLNIHLGQVLSKGEKMDFVIQKATELGVTRITPLFSERSVIQLKDERLENKNQHFQKIAIHATEQCGRTVVPVIENFMPLTDWLIERTENTRLILDPISSHSLLTIDIKDPVALLIGPEGGFTKAEIDHTIQQGFQSLRLGPRILRTETAALAALTALQYIAGDLGK